MLFEVKNCFVKSQENIVFFFTCGIEKKLKAPSSGDDSDMKFNFCNLFVVF